MKTISRPLVLLFLATIVRLTAQVQPSTDALPPTASPSEALQFRTELAGKVLARLQSPADALAVIKEQKNAAGLDLPAEVDFAYAAIDIARRLVVDRQLTAAEPFFRAAEEALGSFVNTSAKTDPVSQAEFLRRLALIRAEYLGKAEQAKTDLTRALVLQPDDPDLRRAYDRLVSAETAKANAAKAKGGAQ